MAKRRLADEYDAAQERGEVASVGKPVIVPDGNNKATTADIGLTRKEVHEARQIRNAEKADPGVVRRVLDNALDAGEEPTKATGVVNCGISAVRPAAWLERTRNNPLAPNRLAGVCGGMGWGPPTCLSHLLRDDLQLRIACDCGHTAEPDLKELREAMWRRCGGEELADLPRVLRCSRCGSRPGSIRHGD